MIKDIVKPIIINDPESGKEYTLEFNRDSVIYTNRQGFKKSEAADNGEEMIPILFHGAFHMHHPEMKRSETDKILFEGIGGLSTEALLRLINLYSVPLETLVYDEEKAGSERKNSKMTVSL